MSLTAHIAEALQLHERFLNLFANDVDKKKEYAPRVWALLNAAYAEIGGIKGSGFASQDDMIKNIPFWKLVLKNGAVVGVIMYKDNNGRKSVAIGCDGSAEARSALAAVAKMDVTSGRAWKEVSGKSLGMLRKLMGGETLVQYAIPVEQVKKILKDELRPPPADDEHIKRIPELKNFYYQRQIGGHWHTKVALGMPGIAITPGR